MNIQNLYRPFFKYFRTKRMRKFWEQFRLTPQTRVLDVGGTFFNWTLLSNPPRLTMANIVPNMARDTSLCITEVIADGRFLPFKENAFDVVYSNSVIEHLFTFENQRQFAAECKRVGSRYYVQTPNRRFPIEPHYIAPFVHWLPPKIQRYFIHNFTIRGLLAGRSQRARGDLDALIEEIRLLDQQELEQIFPEAEIWQERVLGITKSLIAVKN